VREHLVRLALPVIVPAFAATSFASADAMQKKGRDKKQGDA
jgi:hypothetical protein